MRKVIRLLLLIIHLFLLWSNSTKGATEGRTVNVATISRNYQRYAESNPVSTNWYWQPWLTIDGIKAKKISPGSLEEINQKLGVINDEEGDYKIRLYTEEGDFLPNDLMLFYDGRIVNEKDIFKIKNGEDKDFAVRYKTPPGLSPGEYGKIRMEAIEQDTKRVENKMITLVVSGGVNSSEISVESDIDEVAEGEEFLLKAVVRNTGKTAMQPARMSIDNENGDFVVLGVTVPEGVSVVEVTDVDENKGERSLFMRRGALPNNYTRRRGDGKNLNAAGISKEILLPGESLSVGISFMIDEESSEENDFTVAIQELNLESLEDEIINGDTLTVKKSPIKEGAQKLIVLKEPKEIIINQDDIIKYEVNIESPDIEGMETIKKITAKENIPSGFKYTGKVTISDGYTVTVTEEEETLTFEIEGELLKGNNFDLAYEIDVLSSELGSYESTLSMKGYSTNYYYSSDDLTTSIKIIEDEFPYIEYTFSNAVKAGEELEFEAKVFNLSLYTLDRVEISIVKPEGFEIIEESLVNDDFQLTLEDEKIVLKGEISPGITTNIRGRMAVGLETKEDDYTFEISSTAYSVNKIFDLPKVEKNIRVYKDALEGLFLDKQLSKVYIERGDSTDVTIGVKNIGIEKLNKILVIDEKPEGMNIDIESVWTNKGKIELLEKDDGNKIIYEFTLEGDYEVDETINIGYSLISDKEAVRGSKLINLKGEGSTETGEKYISNLVLNEFWLLEKSDIKLSLEKTSSMVEIKVGDVPDYVLKLKNNSLESVERVVLEEDVLKGFVYLDESARVDNKNIKLSTYKEDNKLRFLLEGTLEAEEEVKIHYSKEITEDIEIGDITALTNGKGYSKQYYYETEDAKINHKVRYLVDDGKLLLVEKEGSKDSVGIGELIKYKLSVKNTSEETITNIELSDRMPRGLKLMKDSVSNDNMVLKEVKADSATVVYELDGDLLPGEKVELDYISRVENSAKRGNLTNTAWAKGYTINKEYRSNIASFTAKVSDDAFDTKGIIFGRVYIDTDDNKLFNNEDEEDKKNKEIGVPGVKVYLENGDYAITDREGMYSIYGQKAITHVVKIDRYTIPTGASLIKLTNRHNKKGDLSYADLKNGQLHKVNFAFTETTPEFIEKVESRRNSEEGFYDELEYELKQEIVFKSDEKKDNSKDSQKIKGDHKEFNFALSESSVKSDPEEENKIDEDETLENKLMKMNNELDFIELKDGDRIRNNATIRIKGPRGGYLNLYVNDDLVPIEKIGSRASSQENDLFFLEYNLIELLEGMNKLSISYSDMFNIERERKSIEVIRSGKQEDISIELLNDPIADPSTPILIKISALDSNGNIILSGFQLEAEADEGQWISDEVLENPSIIKISSSGGEYILKFRPPSENKTVNMRFLSNSISKDLKLKLNPDLRPLIVSGIVEGRYDKYKGNNEKSIDDYIFEDSLSGYDPSDSWTYSSRNAVFAKGKVRDEYLLTLSYDDNKEEESFFKDIEPDKHYPIYGDSSIRGYEGKSTSDLYLRIDKNYSSILYGDYTADWTNNETTKLGKVNRTLTGGYHKLDIEKLEIHTFVAETEYNHLTEEQRGRGISGPYHLDSNDIVVGSEEIKLIIRDRVLSSVVIEEEVMKRNIDYTMDYETGTIYFLEPVMSTTSNGYPIFIRTDYEVNQGGEKHWVWGNNLQYKFTDDFLAGWNFVKDKNPEKENEVYSVFSKLDFTENAYSTVEYAETRNDDSGNGSGIRADFKMKTDNSLLEIEVYDTDENFDNDSSSISSGEKGYKLDSYKTLESGLRVFLKNKYGESKDTDETRQELEGGAEKTLSQNYKLELKGRYAKEEAEETNESTSIGARLTHKSKMFEKLTNFVEYENDIKDIEKKRMALGSDYEFENKTKLYLRQELFSTYEESFALTPSDSSNATLVGIESDYFESATLFSEYSLQNTNSEKEAKASMGVKKDIKVTDDLSGAATFERIFPISYEDSSKREEATAATLSYKWDVDETKKMTGNIEGSVGDKKDIFTNRLGYVEKIDESNSIIFKERYIWEKSQEGDKKIKSRIIMGMAHRDFDMDKSNWLLKYEVNYEEESKDDYTHKAYIINHARNYQIDENKNRTLTLAGKYVEENLEGYNSNYFAYMAGANYSIDISEKLDINFNGAAYGDEDFDEFSYGIGVEIGVRVMDNLWISGGYNVTGFTDKDFDEYGYYREGIYIRFRINFTEDVFNIRKKGN